MVTREPTSAPRRAAPSAAGGPLVLVVEDQAAQRSALRLALEARGFRVEEAVDGTQALAVLTSVEPALVILDLGLPDMDGVEVCRRLRGWVRCPVIVVSADDVEARMVEALDTGADDYVVKPVSTELLLARMRVALRHAETAGAVVDATHLECGDLRIDVAAHQAFVGGEPLDLQRQQFTALSVLVRNEGRVLTYATLARALWGFEPDEQYLNSLRMVISKTRRDLGVGARRPVIHTEHRVGYRLTVP